MELAPTWEAGLCVKDKNGRKYRVFQCGDAYAEDLSAEWINAYSGEYEYDMDDPLTRFILENWNEYKSN